jgi:type IX secretion system substrate protein
MKTIKACLLIPIRVLSTVLLFCIPFNNSFCQTAEWVSTQLPYAFPGLYHYSLGETCIIFADDTSQAVYAFDIEYGDWQVLLVPTELEWEDAEADGNAAMIYNDSIVVGYSAITHTFSAINYSGTLLSIGGFAYGCIDNFAYFVTDQLFYVFDAEDGTWHSTTYQTPGAAPMQGSIMGSDDYIYLVLSIVNQPPRTITAYSLITKTFDSIAYDYILLAKHLAHGFTYEQRNEPPYVAVGYSAYTGQFKTKTHSRLIEAVGPNVYEELVSPLMCEVFVTNEQISGDIYRFYFWVYNTVIGDFAEHTFEYTYAGSDYQVAGITCGGQIACVIIRNGAQGDKLEYIVYSAETNSYTHFDTPLFNWGLMSFICGGEIIDAYDENNFYLYDVKTGSSFTHPVEWTQSVHPGITARGTANYWDVFAYNEQYADTAHVFSYTRDDNNLFSFVIPSKLSSSVFRGSDFYALLATDLGVVTEFFLYSPRFNNWIEKSRASTSYFGSQGNYFYLNLTNINQTYFYDGYTNQEYHFTSAQTTNDVYARENVFLMYSTDGKYIGYSMNNHDYSEYISPKASGKQWAEYIILNTNVFGEPNENFVYDGFNNVFVPLTLNDDHGLKRITWAGGKTALVATANGYLFAYKPGVVVSIEENINLESAPNTFSLSQNYPNPFNPTTKIKFTVPRHSGQANVGNENVRSLQLKVYDILGNEITRLVDEAKFPGTYEVEFEGNDLSSGVYFYQLKAGDFLETRKMILIK